MRTPRTPVGLADVPPRDRALPDGVVERFNGTVLEEFFRPATHARLFESGEALQVDLEALLHHYNHEPPHLGYPNQGRRPWETVEQVARQGGQEDR